jgi:hypothetical protein
VKGGEEKEERIQRIRREGGREGGKRKSKWMINILL